ncbi:MAG TPA: NAD(P)H-hydrate dehydratase [Acidimicrobiales bacterium]|nr:NAD(P)H-hydrate dehydratase [Acidimicrobiales bacterium]
MPRADVVDVDHDVLAAHPLPRTGEATSKNQRGRVLVVGGTEETPGALILTGLAALRAGAGKLQLATVADAQSSIAAAVPEARVIAGLDGPVVVEAADDSDAVVLGVGMFAGDAAAQHRDRLVDAIDPPVLVLDAGALTGFDRSVTESTILVPNPGEMEDLLGGPVDDPADAVRTLCARTGATVALRGPETWITGPDAPVFVFRGGHPGLATSGSGDVLSGVVGGLAAQGAEPLAAVLHGVVAHGRAGHRAAERIAPVGFLARELLGELPAALDESRNCR